MRYPEIRYLPQDRDPSITITTEELVAKVIDNTGLLVEKTPGVRSIFGRYGVNGPLPISHHLGYHGIRAFYHKEEMRNLVVPLASWLNLQSVHLEGVENDPVDERSWAGVGRGWPMKLNPEGSGATLTIDPMPMTQFRYALELQPSEPDGIDFSVRFLLSPRPEGSTRHLKATWPCYVNAYDDLQLRYPKGPSPNEWEWATLGRTPDTVIGEPVGYRHRQEVFHADQQALPVAFGRIGKRILAIMFDDPGVRFFMVNAGGLTPTSTVQSPAWDFSWEREDYPFGREIGFSGRIIYTAFRSEDEIEDRYHDWLHQNRRFMA
jgi:hypothetical protein